mmetsp:Transcript_23910/g.56337  ORF Transcript_23910/g.56337 Transcript_23910/m.56337 type:complete len:406 (-) Transcript_23910:586-1803(-)
MGGGGRPGRRQPNPNDDRGRHLSPGRPLRGTPARAMVARPTVGAGAGAGAGTGVRRRRRGRGRGRCQPATGHCVFHKRDPRLGKERQDRSAGNGGRAPQNDARIVFRERMDRIGPQCLQLCGNHGSLVEEPAPSGLYEADRRIAGRNEELESGPGRARPGVLSILAQRLGEFEIGNRGRKGVSRPARNDLAVRSRQLPRRPERFQFLARHFGSGAKRERRTRGILAGTAPGSLYQDGRPQLPAKRRLLEGMHHCQGQDGRRRGGTRNAGRARRARPLEPQPKTHAATKLFRGHPGGLDETQGSGAGCRNGADRIGTHDGTGAARRLASRSAAGCKILRQGHSRVVAHETSFRSRAHRRLDPGNGTASRTGESSQNATQPRGIHKSHVGLAAEWTKRIHRCDSKDF